MRVLIFISLFSSIVLAQKPLDSLVMDTEQKQGLFTTYFSEKGTLYFELTEKDLHKDLLLISRLAHTPEQINSIGDKRSSIMIHFVKQADQILLLEIPTENIARKTDPIFESVQKNNTKSILHSFKIKNEEDDRYLIDVSDYFQQDSPGFSLNLKGKHESKRSFINTIRTFVQNIEVASTLTFTEKENANTYQINISIIALPDDQMPIRYADSRVGYFTIDKTDYSSEALKADSYEIVQRFRLEPIDEEAYRKGELVLPKKPIVFYLDPATPKKLVPYIKKGIEDWNIAFEQAGFKHAIQAKEAPSKEEDPDFHTEDVRYSIVRYVASDLRNATGPRVADPRTGEIIESDVLWYHNHLQSYRNRYLIETGAANPSARTLNTPIDDIGEMMRQVIAHEVGHSLGLRHNFKASSAYPVDSLRSATFTQKMGLATSLMDYTRYNYVAQPGDEGVRFVRQMGPYDLYSIEWGYRYFPEQSPIAIRKSLKKWVDEKSTDPIFMFGSGRESGTNDPNAITENVGDDIIKANTYGMKNLKIVAENLYDWVVDDGDDFDELRQLYSEMVYVYRRYVGHALSVIGGVHETLLHSSQKGYTYQNVDRRDQLRALEFLNEHLWIPPYWITNNDLTSYIYSTGSLDTVFRSQMRTITSILDGDLLSRMISQNKTLHGNGLPVHELLSQLDKYIFVQGDIQDVSVRNLQKHVIERANQLLINKEVNPEVKGLILGFQNNLLKQLKRKSNSSEIQAHYDYCKALINNREI